LFDTQPARARAIWRFVSAGLDNGDTVVVVARRKHWQSAARLLRRGGWPVDGELESGRLVVLDADVMLASFMRRGTIDVQRFDDVIGCCVRDLMAGSRRRVRIYGEMVDILAEEANLHAARDFTDPKTAGALHAICGLHTRVESTRENPLGNWVLKIRCRNAA
jgi:hypothetical protein